MHNRGVPAGGRRLTRRRFCESCSILVAREQALAGEGLVRNAICLAVVMATAAIHPRAQGQQQSPVRTRTTGVVMDMSVVDKDGKPVTDLNLADFELSEDGVIQEIASVTLVRGG